jgi:import inner membrane translocase subunit TIM50
LTYPQVIERSTDMTFFSHLL